MTGAFLAWRALHRAEPASPSAATPPPASVVQELESSEPGLRSIRTPRDIERALFESRQAAESALSQIDLSVAGAAPGAAKRDLVEALSARLAAYLNHDFDSSVEDAKRRGWDFTEEDLEQHKEWWQGRLERRGQIRINPSVVDARTIPPDHVMNAKLDSAGGYGSSIFAIGPGMNVYKSQASSGTQRDAVEVRVRARMPNLEGEQKEVFLGYRFFWNDRLGVWQWLQTAVYSRSGDGPFRFISPI